MNAAEADWADGAPQTALDVLDRAAAARPDATAVIFGNAALTYAEYVHAVDVLAADLAHTRGARVAILMANSLGVPIAIYAAHRAGAVATPLNPDYTAHELGPILADAAPAAIVADAACAAKATDAAPPGTRIIVAHPDFVPTLLARARPAPPAPTDPDAHAFLLFTGGTTGRAKGVLLTHRAIAANIAQFAARVPGRSGDEVTAMAMPLFHTFGIALGIHNSAHLAGTLVILPRYRPDWLLDAIDRHRVTRLPAGPAIFASLLGFEGLARARLASVRLCLSGSAPLSAATLERWEAATGIPICEGYGMTEAGPVLAFIAPGRAKLASVGPALPGTQIEIVDPADSARVLRAGEQGEIRVRGPQIMTGYLDRPEETAAALKEGWLYTGDIGRLDADGDLFIEDRKKDMTIVGGFNVYPREVDEALCAHPHVAEAAAVGVPCAAKGERIVAFVVAHPGTALDAAAIEAHCAERLVKYKRPAEVRLIAALPRTGVNKVDKVALRTLAREEGTDVA